MSDSESRDHIAAEKVAHLLELTEIAIQAQDLEDLGPESASRVDAGDGSDWRHTVP